LAEKVPCADEDLHLLLAATGKLADVALARARCRGLRGCRFGFVLLEKVHTLFCKRDIQTFKFTSKCTKNVFEAEIDELDYHQKVYWDPGGELGAHAAIEHLSIFLSVHFSFYVFSNLIELMVNFNLWQLY
jgi:hypothetical protein